MVCGLALCGAAVAGTSDQTAAAKAPIVAPPSVSQHLVVHPAAKQPRLPRMPPGTTIKRAQERMNAYARASKRTYAVDASRVDSASLAASPGNPFTYLTLDQCRDLFSAGMNGPNPPGARIYNHFQVCGWGQYRVYLEEYLTIAGLKVRYKTGMMDFRLAIMGWPSGDPVRLTGTRMSMTSSTT